MHLTSGQTNLVMNSNSVVLHYSTHQFSTRHLPVFDQVST